MKAVAEDEGHAVTRRWETAFRYQIHIYDIFQTLKLKSPPLSSFFFLLPFFAFPLSSSPAHLPPLSSSPAHLPLFVQDAKVKEQDDAEIAEKMAEKNPLFTALVEGKKLNIFGRDDQESPCDKCLEKWESGNKPNGYVPL